MLCAKCQIQCLCNGITFMCVWKCHSDIVRVQRSTRYVRPFVFVLLKHQKYDSNRITAIKTETTTTEVAYEVEECVHSTVNCLLCQKSVFTANSTQYGFFRAIMCVRSHSRRHIHIHKHSHTKICQK